MNYYFNSTRGIKMKYLANLLLFFSFISNAQIVPGLDPEEYTISCDLGDGETLILTYDRFEIESKFFVIRREELQLGQREQNDCVETHTYTTTHMTHYKFSYRDLTEVLKAERGDLCNLMEKKLLKSKETVRVIGEMELITCKKETTENCGPKGLEVIACLVATLQDKLLSLKKRMVNIRLSNKSLD